MSTTDIVHRLVNELKQEAKDLREGLEGDMVSADDSAEEVLDAVALMLEAVLEAVPAPEVLGDATIILPASEPFGQDGRSFRISGDAEEDPDNPGSALPAPDATEEEKLIAYDTIPMDAVLKLTEMMNIPASLATDAERSYVRNHRLVKGGYDYDNIDVLLNNINKEAEKNALNDLATGVDWDIPEELRAQWSTEDGEQNGS